MSATSGRPLVEVCVAGLSSALVAGENGADRVELCEHLAVGGLTPSAGAIAVACRSLDVPVHVLIRPRGGDFVYRVPEFDAMLHDIDAARDRGASGVVLGVLNLDGSLDRDRTARLVAAARPLSVTFHRAFDLIPDPEPTLDTLIELGIDRLLTSGQAPTARDGLAKLASWASRTRGRLTILAGGRLTASDLPVLAGAGITEFHLGSAATKDGMIDPMRVRYLRGIAGRIARPGDAQ